MSLTSQILHRNWTCPLVPSLRSSTFQGITAISTQSRVQSPQMDYPKLYVPMVLEVQPPATHPPPPIVYFQLSEFLLNCKATLPPVHMACPLAHLMRRATALKVLDILESD